MMHEKPKRKENITVQDLGDETLLYDSERENVHILNYTAQLIWNLCDGEHTIEEIFNCLIKNFPNVPQGDLFSDLQTIINDFKDKNIINC
ncbi:MAG: PqqD family protein [Desulfobacterota bacterium]|nr:PqqD family protein [Thermodesulfobacteriota bacterium]